MRPFLIFCVGTGIARHIRLLILHLYLFHLWATGVTGRKIQKYIGTGARAYTNVEC